MSSFTSAVSSQGARVGGGSECQQYLAQSQDKDGHQGENIQVVHHVDPPVRLRDLDSHQGILQAFHMRCQRQLVCWDHFVTNTYISSVTGLKVMCTIMRLRRLSFVSHVARLDHTIPAWKAWTLRYGQRMVSVPIQDGVVLGVVHGTLGWTILKKTSLFLRKLPLDSLMCHCAWPPIDRLGEVSATVLRLPRVFDDDDD